MTARELPATTSGVQRKREYEEPSTLHQCMEQSAALELTVLRRRVEKLEAVLEAVVRTLSTAISQECLSAAIPPTGGAAPDSHLAAPPAAASSPQSTPPAVVGTTSAPAPPDAFSSPPAEGSAAASPLQETSPVAAHPAARLPPPTAPSTSTLAPAPSPSPSIVPRLDVGSCSVAMAATRVVAHQLVLPADVNQLGICTGGQVLSWIDVVAGLSAKTLAHGPCVTASVDAVHFLRPCRLGCVVIIAALVSRTFNTSMEVTVVVESEDMRTGVRHHCCSAHLTFVIRPRTATAVPAAAAATAKGLPRVVPTTPDHRAMWEGAELRRQQRLERRTRVRRNPELRDAERICRLQPITHREGGPTLPPAITLQQHPPPPPLSQLCSGIITAAATTTAAAASAQAAVQQDPTLRRQAKGPDGPDSSAPAGAAGAPPLPPPPPLPRRQGVSPGCTTAYMTQSILPQHANTLDITFGGQVMSWMEQCAYISASRLRAPALLTAAMDSVSFVRPTRVGDILYITAQVTAIFGSSLEVMVSVFGESPYGGHGGNSGGDAAAAEAAGGGIFHCADAFVTVVAVDERHASPVPVPFELDPLEPADRLRYQGAVARRAERLALRGEFAAAECTRMSLDGSHTYSPPPEAAAPAAAAAEDAYDGVGGGGSSSILDVVIPPL